MPRVAKQAHQHITASPPGNVKHVVAVPLEDADTLKGGHVSDADCGVARGGRQHGSVGRKGNSLHLRGTTPHTHHVIM